MSINRVTISGNLTRDGELRETRTGVTILQLGVAVNDRRKSPDTGEWEDKPNFVDCKMFGSRAQNIAQYMTKGTKVAIDGRLDYSSWEKDGQRRSKLEVVVDQIEFMSRREGGGQRQRAPQPQQGGQVTAPGVYQPSLQPQPQADVYEENVPF